SSTANTPTCPDGTRGQLERGARLEVHKSVGKDLVRRVRLHGSARFWVSSLDTSDGTRAGQFFVFTNAAVVHTTHAEFHVRVLDQVTVVNVGTLGAERPIIDQIMSPEIVYVAALPERRTDVGVQPGEHAIVIRGGRVIRSPAL